MFEAQWRKNLFAGAVELIKLKVHLKQFQVFDLVVLKGWPAAEVARSLGVSLANVYVIRHRITSMARKEVKRLENELEQRGLRISDSQSESFISDAQNKND